jgi:hypothetical protein
LTMIQGGSSALGGGVQQVQRNPALGFLSGAMGGMQLGQGTGIGGGTGALLGGLLGGFA